MHIIKRIAFFLLLLPLFSEAQVLITATGTSNIFNVNYPANISSISPGMMVTFFSNQTIYAAASINLNGIAINSILKNFNQPLVSGDILLGQPVTVIFDGSNWQLLSTTANTPTSNLWTISGANLQPINSYGININSISGAYFIGGNQVVRTDNNQNILIGNSGSSSLTGIGNSFLGSLAGSYVNTGNYNTFIGEQAGAMNTSGVFNTFVGQGAGGGFLATGSNNTFMGGGAGYNTATGSGNSFFGFQAGSVYYPDDGSNNTFIGYRTDANGPGYTNATAIGANAIVGCSNCMVLGGIAANAIKLGIGTRTPQNTLDVVGGARIENLAPGGALFANSNGDLYVGSIGGILGSGTVGGVTFWSNNNTITANGGNFYWDNTNQRLGIRTSAPATALDVNGGTTWSGNIANFTGNNPAGVNGIAVNTNISGGGSGILINANGGAGNRYGINANSAGSTGPTYGTFSMGASNGNISYGVYGLATGTGANYGVYGTATGASGIGVYGSGTYPGIFMGGNVGIGTVTPPTALAVNGAITVDNGNVNDGTAASFQTSALRFGNTNSIGISSQKTTGTNQNGIDFWTAGSIRMQLQNTGYVGIGGNFAAATRLHQHEASNNANYFKLTNNNTATTATDGTNFGIDISGNSEIRNYEFTSINFFTNNVQRMSISNAGVLQVSNLGGPGLVQSDALGNLFVANTVSGLVDFKDNLYTTSPNNTIYAAQLQTIGATTNMDMVLSPKGSGSLLASVPDGTSVGGNKRGGFGAIDFQLYRTTATQVASGSSAVLVGGNYNTASGSLSFVGSGNSNVAAGSNSAIVNGQQNLIVSGNNWSGILNGSNNTISGTSNSGFIGAGNYNLVSGSSAAVDAGSNNIASGDNTGIISGVGNFARSYGEAVVGTYNVDYTPSGAQSFQVNDRIFTVGNGSAAGARSNAMTILKNGNIGIGNITPTRAVIEQNGAIGSTAAIFGVTSTGGGVSIISNYPGIGFNGYFGSAWTSISAGYGADIDVNPIDGLISFNTFSNASSANSAVTASTRMVIMNSGNVGIGTNTPNSKLQVNGSLQLGYTSASSGNYTLLPNDCIVQGTTAGSYTFTLPACNATNNGRIHYLIVQSGPPWSIASSSSVLGVTSVPPSSGFVTCLCVNGAWYTK